MYVGYAVLLLDAVSMNFIGTNMNLHIKMYWSSTGIGIAILLRNSISIGVVNTFIFKYWYWCCQYCFSVLLTALACTFRIFV